MFCITGNCQSIPKLDSLLTIPGLFLVAYPDDGPPEALKGLKPLFCKDKSVIKTFLHSMELKPDTTCTGNAYYNYIIQFSSDSTTLNTSIACCFNKNQKKYTPTVNDGNDEYYSFNTKALSYLKGHSVVIDKKTYTCDPLQKSREFYNFLQQAPETYFRTSIYDSAFTKYEGSVLLQFEFPEALTFEEGEQFIHDKIVAITASTNYFYHMRQMNWHKPGFTTEEVVLHINKKDLLDSATTYTVNEWRPYEGITFTVYSNNINEIEAYFYTLK